MKRCFADYEDDEEPHVMYTIRSPQTKEEKVRNQLLDLQQAVSKVTASDLLPIPWPAKPGKPTSMVFKCPACGATRNDVTTDIFVHQSKCWKPVPMPYSASLDVPSLVVRDGTVFVPQDYVLSRLEVVTELLNTQRMADVDKLLSDGFINDELCRNASLPVALATKLVQAGIICPGSKSWAALRYAYRSEPWDGVVLHASMAVVEKLMPTYDDGLVILYLECVERLATLFKQERDSMLLSYIHVRGVCSMVVAYMY